MRLSRMRLLTLVIATLCVCTSQGATADLSDQIRARLQQNAPTDLIDTSLERMRMMQFLNEYHTDTSIELRPDISEDRVGSALRFITAKHANTPAIQEALLILSEIERLRRKAYLHGEELYCYRLLLRYKTLQEIITLHEYEQNVFEPYLQRAQQAFEKNQLSDIEWAKSKTALLDLKATIRDLLGEKIELKKELGLRLGSDAPLEEWAKSLTLQPLAEQNSSLFLKTALKNRIDFILIQKRKQLASLHEKALMAENQFHLQHIQPEIEHDLNNHSITYGVSASFHLPWSSIQTESMTFQYEMNYYQEVSDQMKNRLATEVQTHLLYFNEQRDLNKTYDSSVIDNLEKQWETLATQKLLRTDQFRDIFYLRNRILSYKRQYKESVLCMQECQLDLIETCGLTPTYKFN